MGVEEDSFRLSSNDKALMVTMPLCGYQVRVVHLEGGRKPFVKMRTEARDPKYSSLMMKVFEGLSTPTLNRLKPGILLDYDRFEFLTDPLKILTPDSLRSKQMCMPVAFCLTVLRMSPQHRLTFFGTKDPVQRRQEAILLEHLNDQFAAMGVMLDDNGRVLPLGDYGVRNPEGSGYIQIRRPEEVTRILSLQPPVRRLRIFKDTGVSSDNSIEENEVEKLMRSFVSDALEMRAKEQSFRDQARAFLVGD